MKNILTIILTIAIVIPALTQQHPELQERRTSNSRTYYNKTYNRFLT